MKHWKRLVSVCIGAGYGVCTSAYAQWGFVDLPMAKQHPASAYVLCNPSGDYGRLAANVPEDDSNNACAVTGEELSKSPINAPVAGFKLKGMLVRDVELPSAQAGTNTAVAAVLTDAIWRNQENTECILGTHLHMKDAPMADGRYWEINDIARGGFAGKAVSIAYFYKPHSAEAGGNTEVLFRAGRTFTSVATSANQTMLPNTVNAPPASQPFSQNNAAAVSDNWVDFTTDLSFQDADGTTRAISSILYLRYACDAQDPVEKQDAIHLRTTGQGGQTMEIAVPGLVPVDANVNDYE